VTGIGGLGKSSVAGRAMTRLKEDGWAVAAVQGRISLSTICPAVGEALRGSHLDPHAVAALASRQTADEVREPLLLAVLRQGRLCLVLDNFEDNLTHEGAWANDSARDLAEKLFCNTEVAALLITSRYPVPGAAKWLEPIPLPPLSPAETRKLIHRLPAMKSLTQSEYDAIQRRIGGHPRMLEFLDAVMRQGKGRFGHVMERIAKKAREAGVDLSAPVADLDDGVRRTLEIGARDVFLDELLAIARASGDEEALLQAAVSALPIEVPDLARALHGRAPSAAEVSALRASAARLRDLSLLELVEDICWVHRWTAEALKARVSEAAHRERCARVGALRAWRVEHVSHALEDGIEAARSYLEARDYENAAQWTDQVLAALARFRQLPTVVAFAREVLATFPRQGRDFAAIADAEANALIALGETSAAMKRAEEVHAALVEQARDEPDRADYQRDLSVSYSKMGDLFRALGQGENARKAFQQSLEIAEKLARAEPDRADYQRDLSVSYNKMGDLCLSEGRVEAARTFFEKDLAIAERLAAAEPDRADYQVDLAISFGVIARLSDPPDRVIARRGAAILSDLERTGRLQPSDLQRLAWIRELAR